MLERASWTFTNEVRFVEKLGTFVDWRNPHIRNPPTRAELLRGYLRGLERREGFTEGQRAMLRERAIVLLRALVNIDD